MNETLQQTVENHIRDIIDDSKNSIVPSDVAIPEYAKSLIEYIYTAGKKDEQERIAALCYQLETDGEKMYHLIFNHA
jgi:hypothetical protein